MRSLAPAVLLLATGCLEFSFFANDLHVARPVEPFEARRPLCPVTELALGQVVLESPPAEVQDAAGTFSVDVVGADLADASNRVFRVPGGSAVIAVRGAAPERRVAVFREGLAVPLEAAGEELHAPIDLPQGASLVSVVVWRPGVPGALSGVSLHLVNGARTFASDLPALGTHAPPALGSPMLLDPTTAGDPFPEEGVVAGERLPIRPCAGSGPLVPDPWLCPQQATLVLALVDGQQVGFGPHLGTVVRFDAPLGLISEENLVVDLPAGTEAETERELLVLQLAGYRRTGVTAEGEASAWASPPREIGRVKLR